MNKNPSNSKWIGYVFYTMNKYNESVFLHINVRFTIHNIITLSRSYKATAPVTFCAQWRLVRTGQTIGLFAAFKGKFKGKRLILDYGLSGVRKCETGRSQPCDRTHSNKKTDSQIKI